VRPFNVLLSALLAISCSSVTFVYTTVAHAQEAIGQSFTISATDPTKNVPQHLSVTDHRPVSAAVTELVRQHHWVVTYEDPFYENLSELQDITWQVAKPGRPAPPKQLFAYEGLIELTYSHTDGAGAVTNSLLEAYHKSGHGYEFTLTRSGSMLHVTPALSRDAGGVPRARQSRLDLPVTVAAADRTVGEFLVAVLIEVQRVSGRKISVSFAPSPFADTKFAEPVRNEKAQSAIGRALAATGRDYSWQLLCGVGSNPTCVLNLTMIPDHWRVPTEADSGGR